MKLELRNEHVHQNDFAFYPCPELEKTPLFVYPYNTWQALLFARATHQHDDYETREVSDYDGFGYLVDCGVVDDFVGEPDAVVGELLARLVGDLHGALDAPAESVCLRQLDGDGAPGVLLAVLLERLDHIACEANPQSAPTKLG